MPTFVPGMSVAPQASHSRKRSTMRKGKRSTGLEGMNMAQKKRNTRNTNTLRGIGSRRNMAGNGSTGSTGGNGNRTLSAKGSLHVMHKTTSHTKQEVHDAHVAPHLRL